MTDADPKAPYYESLGRFVDMFAQIETAMAFTLWHYTRTPREIARAVFSGVRVDAAIQLIKRLAEVTDIPDATRHDLEYIFAQLGAINSARNDILHFGARGDTVSNFLKAHRQIVGFPISPAILADMTGDLDKIILHLQCRHMGRRVFISAKRAAILQVPWRYKHQPQPM